MQQNSKRTIHLLRVAIGSLSIFFLSCDNILPIPTRSGRNIFGCKAEGIKLKTFQINLLKDNPIFAKITDSSLYISANDYNDKISIIIDIKNISAKGEYILDNNNSALYINNNYPQVYYTTHKGYVGEVNITKFDKKNKIVSGTFEFNAIKNDKSVFPNKLDTTQLVKVTRGRFDIDINKL